MPASYILESIFHDSQNKEYRYPAGAAEAMSFVRLRLQVKAQAENIHVWTRLWIDRSGEQLIVMEPDKKQGPGWYTAVIEMPEKGCLVWYYFVINLNGKTFYYGNTDERLGGIGHVTDSDEPASYQITVYNKGAKTPDWFKHSVMYQIFPDRFFRVGDKLIPKKGAVYHGDWNDPPYYFKDPDTREIVNYDFYGGNLAGIKAKLPYLKDLGISVIYLNPIFEAASNHRYDTGNYKKIDPILGTEEEFKDLCSVAEKMGIRIILDGVFSHTGDDSIYFNRYGHYDSVGAYQSQDSPYYSWYNFHDYPNSYDSWWGFHTLPNVWEETPSYMKYIISDEDSVLHHWCKAGISGWRLDVVDELPEKFSQSFYAELKKTNPDAVLIGEVWEDASNKKAYGKQREYLCGQELDSAMNYVFRQIVLDFFLGACDGGMAHRRVCSMKENYPAHNLYAMMNLVGSHDRERILTLLGQAPSQENVPAVHQAKYRLDAERLKVGKARARMAALWHMTFPGVPSVYYGDEIAMEGYRDPYCRCPYEWDGGDTEMRAFYKQIIALRNNNTVLQTGELRSFYAHGDVYGYARVIDGGKDVFGGEAKDDMFFVLLNRSQEPRHVTIDVSEFKAELFEDALGIGPDIQVINGHITIDVPAYTGLVYRQAIREYHYPRKAGVLMHPTSLPSNLGIGDLGQSAYDFVDFLSSAGMSIWQMLPLNPTGYGNSPYSSPSAFAGNDMLISLDMLEQEGYLSRDDLAEAKLPADSKADYEATIKIKKRLLKKAFSGFKKYAIEAVRESFDTFIRKNAEWLDDYAMFTALKAWHDGANWITWASAFKKREPMAMKVIAMQLKAEIMQEKFNQFIFDRQLKELRRYANERGIQLLGDMPIFVSQDSVDAWADQHLFKLDHEGRPVYVAGVPPDYFSETGQLWGNPQYDWDAMKVDGYDWWIKRIKRIAEQVNIVRIDHFRGFEAYWEIPASEETAINGKWMKGPGKDLFDKLKEALGDVPIVAEDLGVITDEVVKLREDCGFPGMKILHFELFTDDRGVIRFKPYENCLIYTGTHDNNTTVGWLDENAAEKDIKAIKLMLGLPAEAASAEVCRAMIEYCYSSYSRIAIIPVQDILELDGKHRMNLPGTAGGNWSWRILPEQMRELSDKKASWLKELAEKTNRI